MREISYEILDLMDQYGSKEEGIRRILEQGSQPELLMALSPLRDNLVQWLEVGPKERVLQIGSDYGAITGCLAQRAGEVLVLDERLENLEVNKRRWKDLGNIRYQQGSLEDLEEGDFHWVFCIGPRKEAMGLADLIHQAARLVKEKGRLALALQNSGGMKLWAGGEADPDEWSVSLEGLKQILGTLKGQEDIYYPMPDYKLPTAIYSDRYLPPKGELPSLFAEYERPRLRVFSEEEAFDRVGEIGGFPQFANSFFAIWEKL